MGRNRHCVYSCILEIIDGGSVEETVIAYIHVLWKSLMEGVWEETVIAYVHVLWRSLMEGLCGEKQSLCVFM